MKTVLFATLFVSTAALAGDLTPPPGPVAPTMKTLDEIEPYLSGYRSLLVNPRTNADPGFIYEKPPAGADPGSTPVIWESFNGQKDPNGATLYGDGSIR